MSHSPLTFLKRLDWQAFGLWVMVTLLAGIAVLGTVQWLLPRRHVARAAWWIPATVSGRILGAILLFGVVHSDFGFGAILALQTPPALITGATLSVLFRHTERLFPPEISPRPLGL